MTSIFKNKIFASITALLCCALWGISTPIVKMGYNYLNAGHLPSLFLWVGLEFAAAGIITLLIFSITNKKVALPKKKNIGGIALVSLLQTVLQYAFLYVGLLYTTSVKGAILKSTDVFMVAILSGFVFRLEKLNTRKIISCIVGFLGIIIMNLDGLSFNFSIGDGLVLVGILAYSFSLLVIKKVSQKEDPFVLCGYQMVMGGLVLFTLGALLGGKIDFFGILPIFLGLAFIYSISYSLWTVLLKHNSASGITIFSFMTPVFGVLFSAFLLEEKGGVAPLYLVIALALVCVGIILWSVDKKDS